MSDPNGRSGNLKNCGRSTLKAIARPTNRPYGASTLADFPGVIERA